MVFRYVLGMKFGTNEVWGYRVTKTVLCRGHDLLLGYQRVTNKRKDMTVTVSPIRDHGLRRRGAQISADLIFRG